MNRSWNRVCAVKSRYSSVWIPILFLLFSISGVLGCNATLILYSLTPTLVVAPISAQTLGNPPITVSASSQSHGAVTYSVQSGPATITGNIVTLTGVGEVEIQASQAQSGSYRSATGIATFEVYAAPILTSEPVGQTVCEGSSATFTIAASNASKVTWFGPTNLAIGSGPTLKLDNVTPSNDGSYHAVISNPAGSSVTSQQAVLNVLPFTAPSILAAPAPVTAFVTQTATFTTISTGKGILSYQWYENGNMITGATSHTYTTGPLTLEDSGASISVAVRSDECPASSVTSTPAILTVSSSDNAIPPTIISQPTNQTATVGDTATFSVFATGAGALSYRWYRVPYSADKTTTRGNAIVGANSVNYTTNILTQINDGDDYYVVVSNPFGSAISTRASLTVGPGIRIVSQPRTESIPGNTTAKFDVSATCRTCALAYQWYYYAPGSSTATALSDGPAPDGARISGSTTSALTIDDTPVAATGSSVFVVVRSTIDGITQIAGTNMVTSDTAGLFVDPLPGVGNPVSGLGLCNEVSNGTNWALLGQTPGNSPGDIPYQNSSDCSVVLTDGKMFESSLIFWPVPLKTTNLLTITFTVALSTTYIPADGFTMILIDPTQGGTPTSPGASGAGMGAEGIPGVVLAFDTFQDCNDNGEPDPNNCGYNASNGASDPTTVPYMSVGQGGGTLWENPWTYVNGNLNTDASADYSAATFASATHTYIVRITSNMMTVLMDGNQLFNGQIKIPPVVYFGFTAATGGGAETTKVSNLTVNTW